MLSIFRSLQRQPAAINRLRMLRPTTAAMPSGARHFLSPSSPPKTNTEENTATVPRPSLNSKQPRRTYFSDNIADAPEDIPDFSFDRKAFNECASALPSSTFTWTMGGVALGTIPYLTFKDMPIFADHPENVTRWLTATIAGMGLLGVWHGYVRVSKRAVLDSGLLQQATNEMASEAVNSPKMTTSLRRVSFMEDRIRQKLREETDTLPAMQRAFVRMCTPAFEKRLKDMLTPIAEALESRDNIKDEVLLHIYDEAMSKSGKLNRVNFLTAAMNYEGRLLMDDIQRGSYGFTIQSAYFVGLLLFLIGNLAINGWHKKEPRRQISTPNPPY